ncbi:hypothetical protein [Limibacillus halophilus]|uniref:Uncharacterized protein n=1 Tax=Limibacillus halophilus TaxID=1579333 RepID=A0A839SRR2_9PROT|nr:hypothetical protein [Limibacillus halophilus]MBB3065172.1 hypothetical protein [Limibacillus halophilus]
MEMIGSILSVLSPFLVAVIAFLGWLLRNTIEQKRELERKLSDKKYQTYEKLLGSLLSITHKFGKSQDKKIIEAVKFMYESQKEILILAPDSVYLALLDFIRYDKKENDNENKQLENLSKLIIEIRKDMLYSKTQLNSSSILRMLVTDSEH